MDWKELLNSDPVAAQQLKNNLDECKCGMCERVETFSFEQKDGIVRAIGSQDAKRGIPPLWYIPGKYAKYPDDPRTGYVVSNPGDYERELITGAGFDQDWKKYYSASPFDSVLDSLMNMGNKPKNLKH
jgi:hypothetical protein